MKTQHTPGPWNACAGRVCHSYSQDSDFKIAEVSGGNREADARLIAAAPELLALLEALTFVAESVAHLKGLEREILPTTDAARALISRVKGQP